MYLIPFKIYQASALILIALLQASIAHAVNTKEASNKNPIFSKPAWSFELKLGRFEPAIENWETFYGKDYTHQLGGTFAYKLTRQIEIGMEGSWIRDKGKGFLPANNTVGGRVKYQLFPLNAFILFRGIYKNNQWVVPYIGGGLSRAYYKANIQNQSSVDGAQNGTHYRAGIQFLLNNINKKGTRHLKNSFGIINTYFYIEVQKLKANVDSVNLDIGGKSTMVGVLFEY